MKYILSILFIYTSIVSFAQEGNQCKEDLFPYFDKEKRMWGYANITDQMVIEPIFTKVSPYYSSRAIVQKGKYCGVIDCDGNLIIPVQFDKIQNFKNNKTWVQKNNLWGVFDANGKELLKPQYKEIISIQHTEFSWVLKDTLWGLFNEEKGTMLCEPSFSRAVPMSKVCSLIEQNGKLGVLNHVNCSSLIQFNIEHVKKINARDILFEQNNKWGMFNSEGHVIIEPKFDSLIQVKEGLLAGKLNNVWGMISQKGTIVLPFEYENISNYSNGFFRIKKNNKYGYSAINGKIYIQPIYDEATDFFNKKAIVKLNNKYGVIDLANKFIVQATYQSIQLSQSGNYALAKKENDIKSNMLVFNKDTIYTISNLDSLKLSDNDRAVRFYSNGTLKYIDIINYNYLFTDLTIIDGGPIVEETVILKTSKGKCIYNINGKPLNTGYYDNIIRTVFGKYTLYIVELNNKKGLLDNNGTEMYATIYEDIILFAPVYITLKYDKVWDVFKLNGKKVNLEPYSSIIQDWNGKDLMVERKKKWGLLKVDGTETQFYKGISLEYTDGFNYILHNKNYSQLMDENGILDKTKYKKIRYNNSRIEVLTKDQWLIK